MKATLIKNLFRRPQPTNEADAHGALDKGSTIEIVETLQGKMIDGEDRWYKASDGFFYWAGGVMIESMFISLTNLNLDPTRNLIDYNAVLFDKVPQFFRSEKGKGIKIAIIDTGIFLKHPDLSKSDIKNSQNFTSSIAGIDDQNGHGSHVAGLIGAVPGASTGIGGLSPFSELFILKAIEDDGSTSANDLVKALKEAVDLDVDIINLSLDINPNRYNIIESEISRAIQKGIIIVAAAGENELLLEDGSLLCPANKEGIISVGSCDEQFLLNLEKFNTKLNYIIPNNFFWSCFNEKKLYASERGSSMATALVSGIISLIKSSSGDMNKNRILEILQEISISTSAFKSGEINLLNPHK